MSHKPLAARFFMGCHIPISPNNLKTPPSPLIIFDHKGKKYIGIDLGQKPVPLNEIRKKSDEVKKWIMDWSPKLFKEELKLEIISQVWIQ